ncbi:Ig-like domain-containing protein [Sulfurimonas microaerophilic]|uniref:Ig-like domain-containing protein n=1 Tax=Sulfurimonas microaerophilic TaxID=3058392 RepID=UPI0027150EFC|nr:Ig-like domain-containing protein [Sulfurimonas sp. hsl 1-7]
MKHFFLKTSMLSFSTAIVLGITGCGGGGGDTTPSGTTTSVVSEGTAIDGILSGSTVCIDVNKNNVCDAGEDSTTTDQNGKYSLESTQEGPLLVVGGTDKGTGNAFSGTLKAPAGSSVISPLTSAVQALVDSGKTASEAETSVKKAMGLENVNATLTDFNPLEKIEDPASAADAQKILAQQTKLQVLVHAASVTVAGAGNKNAANTMNDVFAAVAQKFDGATTSVSLDATKIESIAKIAAERVYTGDTVEAVAARVAAKVSAENVAQSVAEDASSAEQSVTLASTVDAISRLNEAITKVNTSTQTEVAALALEALTNAQAQSLANLQAIETLQQEKEAQAALLEAAQIAKEAAEAALAEAEAQAQADLDAYKAYLAAKAEAEAAAKAEAEAQAAAAEAQAAAAAEEAAILEAQAAKEEEAIALQLQAEAEAAAAAAREAAALEAQAAAEAAADLAAAQAAAEAAEALAAETIAKAQVNADSTIVSFYVSQATNDANQTNVLASKIGTFINDNNLTTSAAAVTLLSQSDSNATAASTTLLEMIALQSQVQAMVDANSTDVNTSTQLKLSAETKVALVHANYISNLNLKSSVELILAAEQAAAAAAAEAERILAIITANKTEVNAITVALEGNATVLSSAKDGAVKAASAAQTIADSNPNAQTYADQAKVAADNTVSAYADLLKAVADAQAANVIVNDANVTEQAAIDANVSANAAKVTFEAKATVIGENAAAAATALAAAEAAPVSGSTTPAISFIDGMQFSNFDVWVDYDKTVVELRTHSLNNGTFTENAYELNTTTGVFEASTKANSDYVLGVNGWTTESFKSYTLNNGVITFENGMAVQIAAEYDLANPTAEGTAFIAEINAQVPGEDNVTFNTGAKAYILAFKPTTDLYELWDAPTVQEQDPVTFNWYSTDQTFSTIYDYMQSVNSPAGSYDEVTGMWTGVDFERNTASVQCDMFHNCPVVDSIGTEFTSVSAGMSGNLVVTDHSVNPYPQTKVGTWEAKTVNSQLIVTYTPDAGKESYFQWEDNLIGVADGAVRKGHYQAAATEFKIDTEQAEFNDLAVNDIKSAIATFIANGGTLDGGTTEPTPTQLTAVDDSITTQPDTTVTYNVLANDFGGEGTLFIDSVTQGQNGTVNWTGDIVEYIPNAGYAGSDSFTYTITDGFSVATATVNVNISTNNPPVANSAAFTMLIGETISGNIGAIDPEGATVTYSISAINDPSQVFGTATTLSSDGNFTIETVQEGNATITVTMSDGDVNSTVTYSVFVEASMNTDSLYGMSEASQNLTSTEFDAYATAPQIFPADTPLYSFWGVNTDENGTATLEYDYLEFKTDGTFVNPDSNGTHDSQWNSTMTVSMEGTPVAKAVVINGNMSATEIASEITELGELGITLPTGSVVSKVAVLMLNAEYDIWEQVNAYVDGGATPVTALSEMFGNYTAVYNRENYKRELQFAQGEQFSDGSGTVVEVDMTSVYMGLSMEPTIINPNAGTWTATTYTDNNGTTVDMILMTVDDTLVGAYNKNPILVAPGIVLEDGTTTDRLSRGSYTPANSGFVEYYFNDTAAQEIVNSFNATH